MRCVPMIVLLVACQPAPAPVSPGSSAPVVREVTGRALGTTWALKFVEPTAGEDHSEAARAAAERVLAEVDAGMSTWRDDSELAKARAASGPMHVSEDTADVVCAALVLAEATGGAFDPTVQPLMELWGFHGTPRTELPTPEEIAAARAQVDWRRVQVARSAGGRPVLDTGGTALDLSAIAKGHAVDRVSHELSALGLGSHFVEVGGEVRVAGPGARGPLWTVGVELPEPGTAQGQKLALVVSGTNHAVATSGNYRNRYELDGKVLVHTMDARQGEPVMSRIASATVVAPDCRTADGLATALMVMPPDEGMAYVQNLPHVEAALLLFDGEDFSLAQTAGMVPRVEIVSDRVHPDPAFAHPTR